MTKRQPIDLSASQAWPVASRPALSVMTPVLFGRYVAGRRGIREVDQVTAHVGVASSWWMALERGEFVPTHKQLVTIERALRACDAAEDRVPEVFAELDSTPWSALARELRLQSGLPAPGPVVNVETESANLIPVVAEISYRNRQLVATPLALAVAGGYLIWCLQRGAKTSPSLELPPSDLVAFVASVIAIFVVAFGAAVDRTLALMAQKLRGDAAAVCHAELLESRRKNGLDGDDRAGWCMPSALAHLTVETRSLAAELGVSLDRTERLAAVCWVLTFVTVPVAVIDGLVSGWSVGAVAYVAALGVLGALARTLGSKVRVEGQRLQKALAKGLGLAADKGTHAERVLGN